MRPFFSDANYLNTIQNFVRDLMALSRISWLFEFRTGQVLE